MSEFVIASSLCVDTDSSFHSVRYPLLGRHQKDKRTIYWRCAYVFFWMSLYCNSGRRHILYTNDKQPVVIGGIDVRQRLDTLGVEIHETDFSRFDPGAQSKQFRNAFYKYEALKCLSELDLPSILLDVDCLWRMQSPELDTLITSGNHLLIQDTYHFGRGTGNLIRHGISQQELLHMYRRIDQTFNNERPVWYGGELIAGSPDILARVIDGLQAVFDCVAAFSQAPEFANGTSIYDNDEFLSSYVYNTYSDSIVDTMDRYSSRVDTTHPRRFEWSTLSNVPIWHLPAEKVRGFPLVFDELISLSQPNESRHLAENIGDYVGMPDRIVGRHTDLLDKAKKQLKEIVRPRQ